MKYDISGLSVCIGMPTNRDLSPHVVKSLLETQEALLERGIPYEIQMPSGGSVVHHSRVRVTDLFLQSDKNRLFWIDSDIVWEVDDFFKILALSSKLECVGAAYPAKMLPYTFMLNLIGDEIETNEHGCFELGGFGLGFTCVQRKVIEELAAKSEMLFYSDGVEPRAAIFRCDTSEPARPNPKYPGVRAARGEDMAFFSDIRELGYKVNLFPHINLGHIGPYIFKGDFMAGLKEMDHASRSEATGETAGTQAAVGQVSSAA